MSGFTPIGPYDRALLDQVRPEDWIPPEPVDRYDLVVLGGGTGGLVSAAIGAALGARVALVERALLGGDCLNYGCVPSKAVLRAARSWAAARESATRFHGPEVRGSRLETGSDVGDGFAAVMERMRRLRAGIAEVDGAQRFRSLGVDIFYGSGTFLAKDELEVDGQRLSFRRCILATGGRAAIPDIPGLADANPLTNETVFDLEELPEEMVVLGAGPIGSELSLAFARFGTRVTLLERSSHPLAQEEPLASAMAQKILTGAGVHFEGGCTVTRVEADQSRHRVVVETDEGIERSFTGDRILAALGRIPNLDDSFEVAGVATTRRGVVTDDRLRTTNPRIYAVGDVAGRHRFTHVADAHARKATRNALFPGGDDVTSLVVPTTTYLEPEIARVGAVAAELREASTAFDTLHVDFEDVDRAVLEGEEGFLMVHLEEGGDTILGATLVADRAGDIISQLSQAMTLGTGLTKLGDVIFPYPTTAEVIRKAADARRRESLTPRTKKLLAIFLSIWRRFT